MEKNDNEYTAIGVDGLTWKMVQELMAMDPISYPNKAHTVKLAVKDRHDKETRKIARLVKE